MKSSFLTLALAAALATATPAALPKNVLEKRAALCPALDTPLCCQVDVDGVVDATCEAPPGEPATKAKFKKACASGGMTAECCTLPLAGDALLCTAP